MFQICIGGDIFPDKTVLESFCGGNMKAVVGEELYSIIINSDFRIANLETPLTGTSLPIKKNGPVLKAPQSAAAGLEDLHIDYVGLANNHIMDYGTAGLTDTMIALGRKEIRYFGAGNTPADAAMPVFIEKDGLKVCIISCAEHEFSIVTDDIPGANPYDGYETNNMIHKFRSECDALLVLYHGGKEYYRYPSPGLQKNCRDMVDSGADLVLCQHSHCVGCEEKYHGATILYGQGNFIFPGEDTEFWNNGLLVKWILTKEKSSVEYIPFSCNWNGIKKADMECTEQILGDFNRRSEEITQAGFVQKKYKEFAQRSFDIYVHSVLGYCKWERRFDRYLFKGRLIQKKMNRAKALATLNFLDCEAHRELWAEGLREYLKK